MLLQIRAGGGSADVEVNTADVQVNTADVLTRIKASSAAAFQDAADLSTGRIWTPGPEPLHAVI